MSNAQLIRLAVLLSIMLIVVGFALKSTARDATWLFRSPSLLLLVAAIVPVLKTQ